MFLSSGLCEITNGLADDSGRDFDVLDVLEQCGHADIIDLLVRQPHLGGNLLAELGHLGRVVADFRVGTVEVSGQDLDNTDIRVVEFFDLAGTFVAQRPDEQRIDAHYRDPNREGQADGKGRGKGGKAVQVEAP